MDEYGNHIILNDDEDVDEDDVPATSTALENSDHEPMKSSLRSNLVASHCGLSSDLLDALCVLLSVLNLFQESVQTCCSAKLILRARIRIGVEMLLSVLLN